MAINLNKCGIINHKGTIVTDTEDDPQPKLLGIPVIRKYKYLGVIIDKNLNLKDHLEYIETKIKKSIKMINIAKWKKLNL